MAIVLLLKLLLETYLHGKHLPAQKEYGTKNISIYECRKCDYQRYRSNPKEQY